MKPLKVQITASALSQVREQVLHIADDSIDRALAWEVRLLSALRGLTDFHGHAVDEAARIRIGGNPQKIVFEKTYLIHYEVDAARGVVTVVNFRHGARLPRADVR